MSKIHFAKIGDNNRVVTTIVVDGNLPLSTGGVLSDYPTHIEGENYCRQNFGGNWKSFSITGEFRKNPGGVGTTWDANRNAFIKDQPYPSWTFNEQTCKWESPSPYPTVFTYDAGLDNPFFVIVNWSEENLRFEGLGPNNETLFYNSETTSWSAA